MIITIDGIVCGIIGALICALLFGGWDLIECWLVDLSNRRFDKKMDKNTRKEESK